MSQRNPFGYPRLENDDDFVKDEPSNTKEPLRLSSGERSPWERLNSTKTLSSNRHEVYHYDSEAPNDSLDFSLKTEYDHHKGYMCTKADAILQPESASTDHGRVLKNRPMVSVPVTLETKELVNYESPSRTTIHSSKGLAIESHHMEATNRGYSRKSDGGFYST